jgi:hypothetical protein
MHAALDGLVNETADWPDAEEILALASIAEIAALRVQALLPPHVAEADDARMDELEARMDEEHGRAEAALDDLAALPSLLGHPGVALAASQYARFAEVEAEILQLSRANTDLRSLAISLTEKRKRMRACHEALARLKESLAE